MDIEIKEHDVIKGLYYIEKIMTEEEEKELIKNINSNDWLSELTRRVQHYGYKYNYKKRKIEKDDFLGELPDWTKELEKKIFKVINENNDRIKLSYSKFDQLIINEYKKNQGISPHIDCVPCFEDGIISVTIGNFGIMTFSNPDTKEEYDVRLKRRSVVILTSDARYKWTHEINKTKNKNFENVYPRISLTFRKGIL